VTSSAGAATLARAFQYLQSVEVCSKNGGCSKAAPQALYKFLLYDRGRQRLYLSTTDHVDVFDLNSNGFSIGLLPPGGPPPTAAIRGLSLTPDGSQLVVADFGAQKVYLLNPDSANGTGGTTVPIPPVANFANSGPARVAATSMQTAFVGLSGEGGGSGACSPCLGQLNLTNPPTLQLPAPQPQVNSLTGAPLLQANANGDHVFLTLASPPGGPLAAWDAATNQFTTFPAQEQSTDLTAAADGTMFGMRANGTTEIRGAAFTLVGTPATSEIEQIPGRVAVPGIALHPSGALVYLPFLTGPAPAAPPATGIRGGVDIVDAHSGQLRVRIFLPEPLAMLSSDIDGLHGDFLAIDESGQRIFALTTSGLTVVQLANVPLGIGTIFPASGSVSGGTALTIRGSGFHTGTAVTIGGKTASVTFKDVNTLTVITPALAAGPQQIIITNPDGETAALDAAFTAN
jgi:hypothetical protein